VPNGLVVRRDRIKQELISGLQREVLREDVASFALEEFKRQLRARLDDTRYHLATMRIKREKLQAEIANLARAVAEGHRSAALLNELGKRRRNWTLSVKNSLRLTVAGSTHDSKRLRNSSRNACRIFAVARAKAELSKHCTAITLTPEGSSFRIAGNWNLLGGRSGGAGGQNRTGYARLFRAALYQ
jgi:hypothetical protein